MGREKVEVGIYLMEEIYLEIVKEFERLSFTHESYKVHLGNSIVRLDILKKHDESLKCQRIGLKKGLMCFPKIREVIRLGDTWLKISEWIVGETYQHHWTSNTLTEEMLFEMGAAMGSMNKITKKGLYMNIADMHYGNILWDTSNRCIICDLESLSFINDDYIHERLVMLLLLKIKERNMIDAFIEGYKTYRDVSKLVSLCEEKTGNM